MPPTKTGMLICQDIFIARDLIYKLESKIALV